MSCHFVAWLSTQRRGVITRWLRKGSFRGPAPCVPMRGQQSVEAHYRLISLREVNITTTTDVGPRPLHESSVIDRPAARQQRLIDQVLVSFNSCNSCATSTAAGEAGSEGVGRKKDKKMIVMNGAAP